MAEGQYIECGTREFIPSTFSSGDFDFNFYASDSDAWYPSKSYVRIGLTLMGSGGAQPTPNQLVALAENAAGNLFTNVALYAGQNEISACRIGVAQASAMAARTKSSAWLKTVGRGVALNEPRFSKRVMYSAADSSPDQYLMGKNEMYKPVAAGAYATATVAIAAPVVATTTINVINDDTKAVNTVLNSAALTNGSILTGVSTLFQTGMPTAAGEPSGGSVLAGDIIVVNSVRYTVLSVTDETHLVVACSPAPAVAASTDWYIIRKDVIRAPQAANTIYTLWQPPLGIFQHDGALGGGDFKLSLNPNANFQVAAVETKNSSYVVGTTFDLRITSLKFYTYVEKLRIPDSIQEIKLMEYQVLSKHWQPTLSFTVSPFTEAITVFIQDQSAGQNALVPPSRFKTIDNSDLRLQKIQVSFAGQNKPSVPWDSAFSLGVNMLEQRYFETYEELGIDTNALGCESYDDYLQRGPIYHFHFVRDENNRSSEVSVSTTFAGLASGPMSNFPNSGPALVYVIAHFRNVARITTSGGRIVQASA